jgi:manganese/iron transport system permease protein/iron/zinc/copper transport system permease protein
VGTFVVVRGMAYLGHGLAHAVFGGFALSALLGVDVFAGAAVWGVAVALMVGRVSRWRVITTDTSIGVLTLVSFAFGLALLQWRPTDAVDPDALLFGSVLGVSGAEVAAVAALAVLVAAVVVVRYRSFVACTFAPDVAAAAGLPVRRIEAVLLVLLAVSVLGAMNLMGATLVAAAVVVPPATVRLITSRFAVLLGASSLLGALTGAVGMLAAYHADVAPGPMVVLVQGACFGLAAVVAAVRRPGRWTGGRAAPAPWSRAIDVVPTPPAMTAPTPEAITPAEPGALGRWHD